jgi:NAD(P)-dependent dehydrogenase (short-subunit alcohol dehydrogenase family)
MAMMWAPANLARLVGWFLALMDSTCRAFVWRRARRLPGDARAPDALPKWWLGERETPPVAIVTGAGSGIGFATAKRLHALGARVAVVCATLAEAEETSARIAEQAEAEAGAGPGRERERAVPHEKKKKKVQPVAFGADLRDGAAIDALAEALDADHRTPTDAVLCVVHCAGVMRCVFSRVKRSGLEETAAVNAAAPARLTAALAARRLRRRKKKSALPPLRVVTVGSFVHRAVSAREMTRWVRWVDDTRVRKPDEEEEDEKTKTKNVRPGDGVRVFENRRHHVGVRVFSLVARITRCVSRPRRPRLGGHRDQPRVAERAASVLRLRGASARRVGVAGGRRRARLPRVLLRVFSRGRRDPQSPTSREMRLPLRLGGRASRAVAGRRGRARAGGVRARARAVGAALAASDGRVARVFLITKYEHRIVFE